MASFGDRLRQLRRERKMSQQELGQVLGITGAAVSAYELNKNQPDFEMLHRIAAYFGVSVDYLLGRVDNPTGQTGEGHHPTGFPGRLRALRLAKGESQAELARVAGCTPDEIAEYESGAREPDTLHVLRIAKHYRVASEYLLGLTDDPTRAKDLPLGWEQVLAEAARHHMGPDEVAALIRQVGELLERRRMQN